MAEVWIVNGHLPECAYLRSLDDLDGEESCDCEPDDGSGVWDDGFWDEEEELHD
jgi:hypothetical protein